MHSCLGFIVDLYEAIISKHELNFYSFSECLHKGFIPYYWFRKIVHANKYFYEMHPL